MTALHDRIGGAPLGEGETDFRSVLALLDGSSSSSGVLEIAVNLADACGARLTLGSVCDRGRVYRWLGSTAACSWFTAPPVELHTELVAEMLAEASRSVPDDLPVTRLVITPDVRRTLRQLARDGRFDAVVVSRHLLSAYPRLMRELQAVLGVRVLAVDDRADRVAPACRGAAEHEPAGLELFAGSSR